MRSSQKPLGATSRPDWPICRPGTKLNTRGFFAHEGKLVTLRIGIGGPVGSGKTALTLSLCRSLRGRYDIAVVTNDIYTEEDAQFLVKHEALAPERIIGVETGGCPHTAIREDASINLEAVSRLDRRFPALDRKSVV